VTRRNDWETGAVAEYGDRAVRLDGDVGSRRERVGPAVRQYLLAHGLDKRDAFEPLNADVAVEDVVESKLSLHGFLF
jgi:hypothetical protein